MSHVTTHHSYGEFVRYAVRNWTVKEHFENGDLRMVMDIQVDRIVCLLTGASLEYVAKCTKHYSGDTCYLSEMSYRFGDVHKQWTRQRTRYNRPSADSLASPLHIGVERAMRVLSEVQVHIEVELAEAG